MLRWTGHGVGTLHGAPATPGPVDLWLGLTTSAGYRWESWGGFLEKVLGRMGGALAWAGVPCPHPGKRPGALGSCKASP